MTGDAEIIARLTEVAGFTPWDMWGDVCSELRRGKVFYCKQSGEQGVYPNCLVLNPAEPLARALSEYNRDQE